VRKRKWRLLYSLLLIFISLTLVFKNQVIMHVRVQGASMMPTFEPNTSVWATSLDRRYDKGDVVVIKSHGEVIIKRVAFVEGEIVLERAVDGGDWHIPEHWAAQDAKNARIILYRYFKIPEGHVYLIGDDINISEDSRVYGPFPTSDILGVVFPHRHKPKGQIAKA